MVAADAVAAVALGLGVGEAHQCADELEVVGLCLGGRHGQHDGEGVGGESDADRVDED